MIKYIYIYQTTNTNDNMSISNDLHTTLIIIANSRGHCNNTIFNSCFEQDLFLNIKWETRPYLYRLETQRLQIAHEVSCWNVVDLYLTSWMSSFEEPLENNGCSVRQHQSDGRGINAICNASSQECNTMQHIFEIFG